MDPGTIIAGISAASGILGAVGSLQAGSAQSAALERNAEIDRQNAAQAMTAAEADVARQQDADRRRRATAFNAAAGSGVDPTGGSPLELMADMAAQGALDQEITRWRGRTRADAYLTQAGNDLAAADQASTASYLSAGSTLLTTAGRTYQTAKFPNSRGTF